MSWDKVDVEKRRIEEKAEYHQEELIRKELGRMQYEDPHYKSAVRKLYFIIFCIFLFICFLAIIDAPSPLDTYPSGSMLVIPSSFML